MRIVSIIAVAALTAACSASSSPSGPGPAVRAAAVSVQPAAGGVGSTLTLHGGQTVVDVTLVSVLDPAVAADGVHAPAGSRLVGVQLEMLNRCPALFSDGDVPGLAVLDAAGRRLPLRVSSGVASQQFSLGLSAMELYCAEDRAGWALVQVPAGDRVAQVVYTPQGGSTGTWSVG